MVKIVSSLLEVGLGNLSAGFAMARVDCARRMRAIDCGNRHDCALD